MKRFTLFILCACACAALFANNDTIRILGIGNSFTMDAMEQHLQHIFTGEDQPVILLYPYRGGTLLSQHDQWKNRKDTCPYNHCEFRDGVLKKGGDQSTNLLQCVQEEPWDYIIFQTNHEGAGRLKTYDPYLTNLVDFAKTNCSNKNVKIGLYMTWAYDSVSNYSGFEQYGKKTNVMYDSIRNAVKTVMDRHKDLFLIPVGTAIQNGRTSYMGHHFNRDGYHLNYDHGRYIASLTWASVLLGYQPDSVVYQPNNISDYCARMCRAAVREALKTPYDTTSLRAEFGKSESESQPADESRLQRVTFNGLNIPVVEGIYEYTVPVVAGLAKKVTMYSYPISAKAEQNIVDEAGSDVPRDPEQYGYFPLNAPELGQTITYTNHVNAEDGIHITTYVYHLVGVDTSAIVYTIGSKADLDDFAAVVNGGQYGANAKVTNDVVLNMQKQDCWKTPIGTIDHPYTGTFDGQGYTLSGFNIFSSEDTVLYAMKALGLFGAIKDATIKNLTLTTMDECYFTRSSDYTVNNAYCGVLCGWMCGSTISNCHLIASVFTNVGAACGAICGYEYSTEGKPSIIDRCCVEGAWRVRYKNNYGAFIGYAYNVNISNSYSLATMELQSDHGASIGGFIGYMNPNSDRHICFTNCYFAGKISDERVAYGKSTTNTIYLGAIVARSKGANAIFDNIHYLTGSAPAAFGLKEGSAATAVINTFAKANLTDGTLCAQLGGAFTQGKNYPVIKEQEPSLVERFSKYADNSWSQSAGTEMVKNGDVCDWKVFHSRRNTSKDKLACGQYATWFAKTSDGYIQTASALEGGVKEISFLWNKYESDTADIKVAVTVDTITDSTEQLQVPGNPRQNFDFEYIHHFGVKKNALIKIFNPGKKVIHVGDISITPYLRYTNKEVTVDAYNYQALDYKYTNPDLINNTDEDTIIYTLSGKNVAAIASIDSLTGEVTMLSDGTVTVRATWHEVVTTYTLNIQMSLPTTALIERFTKVEQTSCNESENTWEGDIANWKAFHVRRAAKDTLNGGTQATWMKINGYLTANLEGGVKRLKFDWREFVDTAAELSVGMFIDSVWTDTARMQATGTFPTSINETYNMEVGCKQNGTLSFRNLATNAKADRFLLGDLYITPYIFFPFDKRSLSFDQSAVKSFDLRSILIDNTWGEGEIIYKILSDATDSATISGSIVDFSQSTQSGDIQVQATWNDGKVFTSPVTIHVSIVEIGETFTETFSSCTKTELSGTTFVRGDYDVFGWNFTNFVREATDTVMGAQGTRIRYNGAVGMNGAQEGGIKNIEFSWRAASATKPVHFTIYIDGDPYEIKMSAEQSKGQTQHYFGEFHIDYSTAFSLKVGAQESTAQSYIVLGPVTITPYLLFRTKRDTVVLDETKIYNLDSALINNTKADAVYSILSDETGAASIHDGVLDLSAVTKNGNVKVQSTWHNISTTTTIYALYEVTDLESQFTDSPSPQFTKFIRDGQLLILRGNDQYDLMGNKR